MLRQKELIVFTNRLVLFVTVMHFNHETTYDQPLQNNNNSDIVSKS